MKINRTAIRFFWMKRTDPKPNISHDLIEKAIKVKCMVDQHRFYGDDLKCPCGERQTVIVK